MSARHPLEADATRQTPFRLRSRAELRWPGGALSVLIAGAVLACAFGILVFVLR